MKQVRGKYRRNQVNHNHDQMAEITCFGAIVFLTFALKLESPKSQKYAHEVILQSVTSKILSWKKYIYVEKLPSIIQLWQLFHNLVLKTIGSREYHTKKSPHPLFFFFLRRVLIPQYLSLQIHPAKSSMTITSWNTTSFPMLEK